MPRDPIYYRLQGKTPIACADLEDWLSWAGGGRDPIVPVARTTLRGGILVSTVFLSIDHNYLRAGPPVLFETMIFGGPMDQHQRRYSSWVEAERGHAEVTAKLRTLINT